MVRQQKAGEMNLEELVRRKFDERVAGVTRALVGGVKNYEEYRFQIGMIRGMFDLYEDIAPYFKDPDGFEEDDDSASPETRDVR